MPAPSRKTRIKGLRATAGRVNWKEDGEQAHTGCPFRWRPDHICWGRASRAVRHSGASGAGDTDHPHTLSSTAPRCSRYTSSSVSKMR
ncbi:hypothetical protein QQF64_014437 [Cirrhinus molitorella]|uniref:Uncharacterized protein n=1 Tax=Cirrhinus molitorella TaxID=172907 RepID=A0ABR3NSV5_9TELE